MCRGHVRATPWKRTREKRSEKSRSQRAVLPRFCPKRFPVPRLLGRAAPRAPHLTVSEVPGCGPPSSCLACGFPTSPRGRCRPRLRPWHPRRAGPPDASPAGGTPAASAPQGPQVPRTMPGPAVKGQATGHVAWATVPRSPQPAPCAPHTLHQAPRTAPGGWEEVSRITECSLQAPQVFSYSSFNAKNILKYRTLSAVRKLLGPLTPPNGPVRAPGSTACLSVSLPFLVDSKPPGSSPLSRRHLRLA